MFREANLLKKIFLNKNENSGGEAIKGYVDYTYFGLSDEIEKDFFEGDQKAEKRLGYRLREGGEKTSVLVSGSHAMGLINTNLRVSQVEVDDLNKQAENKGVRYSRSKEGFLFLGKHYFDAPQREITKGKGYKADT